MNIAVDFEMALTHKITWNTPIARPAQCEVVAADTLVPSLALVHVRLTAGTEFPSTEFLLCAAVYVSYSLTAILTEETLTEILPAVCSPNLLCKRMPQLAHLPRRTTTCYSQILRRA